MQLTKNILIPAIMATGVAFGMLAATEVNTQMKPAPEAPWRVAAREQALHPVSFAWLDRGPSDLSPSLPWIGTDPNGNIAPLPEDYGRNIAAEYDPDVEVADDTDAQLALAKGERDEFIAPAIERAAERAARTAVSMRSRASDPVAPEHHGARMIHVQPAILDEPMPMPLFAGDPADGDEDGLGG